MSAPAASLTEPPAPRPPRLLQRPVSPAQREAARRNGARSRGPQTAAGKAHSSRNARRHGLYARLHVLTAEQEQAFRVELRDLFEALNPRDPADVALVAGFALASFQFRRAFGLDPEALARNPRDIVSIVRMIVAIGTFEFRYTRLLYRAIPGIENLEKQAAERKSGNRTPELIEEKENAPARQVIPAPPAVWCIINVRSNSVSGRKPTFLLPRAPSEAGIVPRKTGHRRERHGHRRARGPLGGY